MKRFRRAFRKTPNGAAGRLQASGLPLGRGGSGFQTDRGRTVSARAPQATNRRGMIILTGGLTIVLSGKGGTCIKRPPRMAPAKPAVKGFPSPRSITLGQRLKPIVRSERFSSWTPADVPGVRVGPTTSMRRTSRSSRLPGDVRQPARRSGSTRWRGKGSCRRPPGVRTSGPSSSSPPPEPAVPWGLRRSWSPSWRSSWPPR